MPLFEAAGQIFIGSFTLNLSFTACKQRSQSTNVICRVRADLAQCLISRKAFILNSVQNILFTPHHFRSITSMLVISIEHDSILQRCLEHHNYLADDADYSTAQFPSNSGIR